MTGTSVIGPMYIQNHLALGASLKSEAYTQTLEHELSTHSS